MKSLPILVFGVFFLGTMPVATASPWTLPADELVLSLSQDFHYARDEFLPDGTRQAFPLEGEFRAISTRIGARYGFTDRIETYLELNIAAVTFRSDPLILANFPEGATAAEATDSIISFNTVEFGAADLNLGFRGNLLRGPVMITTGTEAKIPTGYDRPTGTFFVESDGSPGQGGQATLGDGQADITQYLHFGTFLPATRTFARLDLGFRYRFSSPGHQGLAGLRAGQFVGDNVVLTAGVGWLQTLFEGEVIGESYVARDANLPANQYTLEDIEIIEIGLDRDAVTLEAGLIATIRGIEVQANYGYTFLGANTAATHVVSLGTILVLPELTARSR